MCRRVLTRVFARRTRRFVTPSNHRGYLRLAKALIRLLRSADVQSQSVQADSSLRTSFTVGCHAQTHARGVCANLNDKHIGYNFQQTTFWNIFLISSKRTLFALHANCLHCMKRSPLHDTSNPVFLVMKRKKKRRKRIHSVVCWISPEAAFPPMRLVYTMRLFYSLNKLRSWFCISHIETTKTELINAG